MSEAKAVDLKVAREPLIHAAIIEVMRSIGVVGKDGTNTQQNYKFRSIDDVYNAAHAAMAKHGIVTPPRVLERKTSEKPTSKGTMQVYAELKVEYDFIAADGSKMTVGPIYAEALDTSDKATNKAMAFAHKYALLQTFCIPTADIAEGDKATPEIGKRGLDAIPSAAPKKVKLEDAVASMGRGETGPADYVEPPPVDEFGEPMPDDDRKAPAPEDFAIPFGKNKGKMASSLTDKDLLWMLGAMRGNAADPVKAKFKADNQAKADALWAIAQHRGLR